MSSMDKKIAYLINNPHKMLKLLNKRLKSKIREQYLKISPFKFSDSDFFRDLGITDHYDLIKLPLPPFFIDTSQKSFIMDYIHKNYPHSIEDTIDDAENITKHVFSILGSGNTNLGSEINWHYDFKSNFYWDNDQYYLGNLNYLDYFEKGIKADVKIPWELNRFQHLVTLGKAYWFTNNEKYVIEFKNQFYSWIKNNNPEMGINWACTMDISIRAINWIWAFYFFENACNLSIKFKITFYKNLYLHGQIISENLELENRNNHLLSNYLGLIYIGIIFKNYKKGKKWLKIGIEGLKQEMEHQINSDGVDYEYSIGYHRLVTEIFISAVLLCRYNDIYFPEDFLIKLKKMVDFIKSYTKPDGCSPLIGDLDDGRIQILSKYARWNRLDHRYLISISAFLFNTEYCQLNSKIDEEVLWYLGNRIEKLKLNDLNLSNINSTSFKESGFYISRFNDYYMIIDAVSQKKRDVKGHKHNSALNFDLFAKNRSFIIDPGSYVYTYDKKLRNLFRSTMYHNVIRIDNIEQNDFDENELFDMGTDAKVKVNEWTQEKNFDYFDAEHYGYKRLNNPITHRRKIYFDKNRGLWIIKDLLIGKGKHLFELFFHFSPMELKNIKNKFNIIKSNFKKGYNIAIINLNDDEVDYEILDGWISYSYGKKIKAPILKLSKTVEAPYEFITLIYPFKEESELNYVCNNITEIINHQKFH